MKAKRFIVLPLILWAVSVPQIGSAAENAGAETAASSSEAEMDGAAEAPPEKGSREHLVSLVTEGAAHYDAKEYDQAIQKLKEAYSFKPSPTIGVVLAHSYRDSGRIGEAIDVYGLVADSQIADDAHEKVVEAVTTAKTEHQRLSTGAVWLTLSVIGPKQYDVLFNDQPISPHRSGAYVIMPGVYSLTVNAEGYESKTLEFIAQAGRKPLQTVELHSKSAVAAAPVAQPADKPAPPPAKPAPERELPKRTKAFKVVGWTGLGLSVPATMVGAGLALYGTTQHTAADEHCIDDMCGPQAEPFLDNARKAANAATIAFAAAGGLFAVGVGFLVYDGIHRHRFEEQHTVAGAAPAETLGGLQRLEVVVGPGRLALEGAF